MLNLTVILTSDETGSDTAFAGLTIHLPQNNTDSLSNIKPDISYKLDPSVLEKIIDLLQQDIAQQGLCTKTLAEDFVHACQEQQVLTFKEKQVLQLLAKGYSYKMIACELTKSVETIRVQLKTIYKKLHVHSNTGAIFKIQNLES